MKHLDLFSGYGGFTISAKRHGMETVGFSEIDKYAIQVLNYHYPNIKNYGDISQIDFKQFNGKVDLVTGGSPCQDLSVAGKRKGLIGARSGLFFEYIRAVKDVKPEYFIWENVKGALSSNGGWDFARVQIEMEQAGYSLEWVVLNAKDFGVPQNRERIFIIGIRNGSEREILPFRENTKQTLRELTTGQSQGYRVYSSEGLATAQASQAGRVGAKTGLYAVTSKAEPIVHNLQPRSANRPSLLKNKNAGGYGHLQREDGLTYTIDTACTVGVAIPVLTPDRLEKRQNGRRFKENGEPSFTLNTQDRNGVMIRPSGDVDKRKYRESSEVGCLSANPTSDNLPMLKQGFRIRRLTPVECERLMGLEDGWTSCDGVISDTQRYKLCGNGVVVNCVDYLLDKIVNVKCL